MFLVNIVHATKENENFRKVLYTGSNSQLVVMNIPVGGDIGKEVHTSTDQIIFIVDGNAEATLGNKKYSVVKYDALFVPAGTIHNVKNTGDKELKLYSIYSPPEHPDGTVMNGDLKRKMI
jgi:mannose-6-phosphate isomerase-like protein (cupin superfamily)